MCLPLIQTISVVTHIKQRLNSKRFMYVLYSFSCVQLSVLKLHLSTPLPSPFSWAPTMSAEARTGSETRPALKINTHTIEALFYASKTDWLSYFSLLKSYGPHRAALPWDPALQQWSKTLPETNLLISRALKVPCGPTYFICSQYSSSLQTFCFRSPYPEHKTMCRASRGT